MARLYGGGKSLSEDADLRSSTLAFARKFLWEEGLPVVAEGLVDSRPRRILYFPASGVTEVKILPARYAASVAIRERQYMARMSRELPRPRRGSFGPR